MSITIVATAGDASANSYVTEVEYIARVATLPSPATGTTVTGAACSETEKGWLIEMQRELTLLPWIAGRVNSTQALAWPRIYAEDPDAPSLLGVVGATDFWFDETEIPQRVKDAQIDMVQVCLAAGKNPFAAEDTNRGLIGKTIDVLSWQWQPNQRSIGWARYPRILGLIAPLLSTRSGGVEVVRT